MTTSYENVCYYELEDDETEEQALKTVAELMAMAALYPETDGNHGLNWDGVGENVAYEVLKDGWEDLDE
jgi:hypothetical protein